MGHKGLFPRPSSDPGSRPPAFTCSGPRLSVLTWGCLVDTTEEESPRFQGAGTLILLLHAELAELGHLLRSQRSEQWEGCWQVQVKRWGEGCGQGQAELTWDEASASSLSGGL